MYGEMAMEGVVPGYLVSVSLTRMLARVDVENKVSGEVFQLEEIFLVNYNTSGYIAPKWDETTGVLVPDPYTANKNPMIPVPSGKQPGTEEAAMKYGYKQAANTPGALMAGKIYTYEAVKNVAADPGFVWLSRANTGARTIITGWTSRGLRERRLMWRVCRCIVITSMLLP